MGSITFGGLATGLDTESLISKLMDIERKPLKRLETEKSYFTNRLSAFSTFDGKLKALLERLEEMDTADAVKSYTATAASETYLKVTGSSTAAPGSYQIEVVDLAQVEKTISQGYASKTDKTFGTGTFTVQVAGATAVNVTIDSSNNSLEGIAAAINAADAGVTAAIINDGGTSPYRLVVTGDSVPATANGATATITLNSAGLSGGTAANPAFSLVQYAQKSHIKVDTIDIYGTGNSFTEAVDGVTIDLLKKNAAGETTAVAVAVNQDGTKAKLEAFVSAYNDVVNFIAAQSSSDWSRDTSFRQVKRQLQDLLVTSVGSDGDTYRSLAQLGITTDKKNGTLSINSTQLNDALATDYDGVAQMLGATDGIVAQFKTYLEAATDSADGVYAGKKASTDSTLTQLGRSIDRMEARLEQREKTMRAQFEALETLVSGLNAQSSYLTQALSSVPKIGGNS